MTLPTKTYEWTCRSEAQTDALGHCLAASYLQFATQQSSPNLRGLIVDLRGPLGAGKTRFSKAVAAGCGIDSVRSPTFTICQRYSLPQLQSPGADCFLYHLDTYRIEDPTELLMHGWDEMCDDGLVLVEWADRIEDILPTKRVCLSWEHISQTERRVYASAEGELEVAILNKLNATAEA